MSTDHLISLNDTDDWGLQFDDQDIRGYRALSEDGAPVGTVSDMLIDSDAERVTSIVLEDGRTYPADDIAIDDGVIYITGQYPVNTSPRRARDIDDYGRVRRTSIATT